ncbi:hypothetical protein Cgig2_030484 [Carnegiea gigantea]|uniref:Uncharacterized protein n=1 Tax=Carnegiea gigantea TaxID=171969 RepID=A0A9Q1QLL7_9CARY|nr:hypothetical protein Cgig2_030484 [Carnegiea gigantea]
MGRHNQDGFDPLSIFESPDAFNSQEQGSSRLRVYSVMANQLKQGLMRFTSIVLGVLNGVGNAGMKSILDECEGWDMNLGCWSRQFGPKSHLGFAFWWKLGFRQAVADGVDAIRRFQPRGSGGWWWATGLGGGIECWWCAASVRVCRIGELRLSVNGRWWWWWWWRSGGGQAEVASLGWWSETPSFRGSKGLLSLYIGNLLLDILIDRSRQHPGRGPLFFPTGVFSLFPFFLKSLFRGWCLSPAVLAARLGCSLFSVSVDGLLAGILVTGISLESSLPLSSATENVD